MEENDHKARVRAAVAIYAEKQRGPTRKNEKPEKLVEKACLAWMRLKKWDVSVFESKATYSPTQRRYKQQSMQAGTADCLGNLPSGISVVVEFKAPGKLSSFARPGNIKQQEYLTRKILYNTFACVVDSVDRLSEIFLNWEKLMKAGNHEEAKKYLISMLPVAKRGKKTDVPPWEK